MALRENSGLVGPFYRLTQQGEEALESRESQRGRGDLWATSTGNLLHLSHTCCYGLSNAVLIRVRDHANPSYFDSDEFKLCPRAAARLTQLGKEALESSDG